MQPSGVRKPTIYDIAKASDSSATAVSLVLNGRWREQRINPETATRILKCAGEIGYAVNLKARGLRLSRSGLAGMILPHYRNRFFAELAEAFEGEVRRLGLHPIVVSTQRDPANEARVTQSLLAQQIEFLFVTGVHDPAPLNALSRAANVRCINVDLPGAEAPSVISDNLNGSKALTRVLIQKLREQGHPLGDWLFYGGVAEDNSTRARIAGFREVLAENGIVVPDRSFDCIGYSPAVAAEALARWHAQAGRLPSGLFANGITALEGTLDFAATLGRGVFDACVVGTFDWDPFAAHLPFDLTIVRQDAEALIMTAFALLSTFDPDQHPLMMVPTRIAESYRTLA